MTHYIWILVLANTINCGFCFAENIPLFGGIEGDRFIQRSNNDFKDISEDYPNIHLINNEKEINSHGIEHGDLANFSSEYDDIVGYSTINVEWDDEKKLAIINDEQSKFKIIKLLAHYLTKVNALNLEQVENFELELRKLSADYPIYITYFLDQGLSDQVQNGNLLRKKRKSYGDEAIRKHIEKNCAYEEEIFTAEGKNAGKEFIIKAQNAENPFRHILPYDDPYRQATMDGLNIGTDIITLGMKPYISNMIASYYRKKYYKELGDDICETRQNRLMVAESATMVSMDRPFILGGKSSKGKGYKRISNERLMPQSFDNAHYYSRDRNTGIQRELLLVVDNRHAPTKIFHEDGRKTFIKRKENGEFFTHHPDANRPELLEKRVIVNHETGEWRYADHINSKVRLEAEFIDGKYFIFLGNNKNGEKFILHEIGNNQFNIVKTESGKIVYLPVYAEPLSKSWHLRNKGDGRPVFTQEQIDSIDRMKISASENGQYQYLKNDLDSRIYTVSNKDASILPTFNTVVEINGNIVPVKVKPIIENKSHYRIYGKNSPDETGYPIEWDGDRWIFEGETSSYVSSRLQERITPVIYQQNIDAGMLSSISGNKGIQWDANGKSYIKIDNNYIKIKKNTNKFYLKNSNEKLYVEFNGTLWKPIDTRRAKGYPEQLDFIFNGNATATFPSNKQVKFPIDNKKGLTESILENGGMAMITDGVHFNPQFLQKNDKHNLLSVKKIVIEENGIEKKVFYPEHKIGELGKKHFYDTVPVNFNKNSQLIVTPDSFNNGERCFVYNKQPHDIHVIQQGTSKSGGYASIEMVAMDYKKKGRGIEENTINIFKEMNIRDTQAIYSIDKLSGLMNNYHIEHNLFNAQTGNVNNYIIDRLKSNEKWTAIADIGNGHFIVLSPCDQTHFYLRDPYQGILAKEKIADLNKYGIRGTVSIKYD